MRRFLSAGAAASVVLMLLAVPVFAQELTGGCVLQVRSFTGTQASGTMVDQGQANGIIAEGDVGSKSRPFKVDPAGTSTTVLPEATVNGLGPRAGNTPIEEIVALLARHGARLGAGVTSRVDATRLAALSRQVAEATGVAVPGAKAVVGAEAKPGDLEALLR